MEMVDNELIQVLSTGGTFDKEYNYINGKLFFKNTHLNEMFDRGRSTLNINVKTLMMIDSLEMTKLDRKLIAKQCMKSKSNKILITHGTDTMVDTAKFLAKNTEDKTIVITGAMIPYAFGSSSDGFFNLGGALMAVQTLPIGIYIVMNGKCFDYNKVRKNKKSGYFERL